MDESLDRKNLIVMKLLHYFITNKNYNQEQLDFDLYKARHVLKKIKKKTFSLKMNALTVYTDLGDNVELKETGDIDCIYLYDEKDINKYDFLYQYFPDINNKLKFSEEGLQL